MPHPQGESRICFLTRWMLQLRHLLVLQRRELHAGSQAELLFEVHNTPGEDAREAHLQGRLTVLLVRLRLERAHTLEVFSSKGEAQRVVHVLGHERSLLPFRAPTAARAVAVRGANKTTI